MPNDCGAPIIELITYIVCVMLYIQVKSHEQINNASKARCDAVVFVRKSGRETVLHENEE